MTQIVKTTVLSYIPPHHKKKLGGGGGLLKIEKKTLKRITPNTQTNLQPLSRQLTNELLVKIEHLDNNPTTFVVGKCTQFVREEQYFFALTHNKAAMNSSILYDNDLLVGKLSSIIASL